MVAEESRRTDTMVGREDYELSLLNQKLALIAECIRKGQKPVLTFNVFVQDAVKAGGSYQEIMDTVKRIDSAERRVILASKSEVSGVNQFIDFDAIIGIKGELLDWLDGGCEKKSVNKRGLLW